MSQLTFNGTELRLERFLPNLKIRSSLGQRR